MNRAVMWSGVWLLLAFIHRVKTGEDHAYFLHWAFAMMCVGLLIDAIKGRDS